VPGHHEPRIPFRRLVLFNPCLLPVVLGFLLIRNEAACPASEYAAFARLATYTLAGGVNTLGLFTHYQVLTGHL
jgi:hypothetical protein